MFTATVTYIIGISGLKEKNVRDSMHTHTRSGRLCKVVGLPDPVLRQVFMSVGLRFYRSLPRASVRFVTIYSLLFYCYHHAFWGWVCVVGGKKLIYSYASKSIWQRSQATPVNIYPILRVSHTRRHRNLRDTLHHPSGTRLRHNVFQFSFQSPPPYLTKRLVWLIAHCLWHCFNLFRCWLHTVARCFAVK